MPEPSQKVTETLAALKPPSYDEKDFGAGTSLLAAYRAGYFDAVRDVRLALSVDHPEGGEESRKQERERVREALKAVPETNWRGFIKTNDALDTLDTLEDSE